MSFWCKIGIHKWLNHEAITLKESRDNDTLPPFVYDRVCLVCKREENLATKLKEKKRCLKVIKDKAIETVIKNHELRRKAKA